MTARRAQVLQGTRALPQVINMEICALRQIIADKDQEIEKLREELAAATFDPNVRRRMLILPPKLAIFWLKKGNCGPFSAASAPIFVTKYAFVTFLRSTILSG